MITLEKTELDGERAIIEARNKTYQLAEYCGYSETQSSLLTTFISELARLMIAGENSASFMVEAGRQGAQFGLVVSLSGCHIENLPDAIQRAFPHRDAPSTDDKDNYHVFLAKPDTETTEDAFMEVIRELLQKNSEPLKLSQLKDALSEEKERLAVTLQSIREGVIATDITGRIVQINRAAAEMIGFTRSEVIETLADDILHIIDERQNVERRGIVSNVISEESFADLGSFTTLQSKHGRKIPVKVTGAPIFDNEGITRGAVLVLRDVNEERIAAREQERSSKLESVGILAGGIAHDFNNYLGVILGNLELVTPHVREIPNVFPLVSQAQKASKRASKLTQQLLTFSKGGEPVLEHTSLSALITESTDFVLRGSNSSCSYALPNDLWMANIDSGQVGQVIQNIVLNAKQAMPNGGNISITCENVDNPHVEDILPVNEGEFIKVTISDNGPGISPALIGKIFDPYFTTKKEGNGLGLAICHSIIRKHGGYIVANSTRDSGTSFTLYLPATKTGLQASDIVSTTGTKSLQLSVLVMDDDKMVREVIEHQLAALGHSAYLANDGESAIERYQQLQTQGVRVDLVILDLTVPGGMGGKEAASKLLKIDPDAKIIVASGYSNDPIMANYRANGFVSVIAKPFDLTELARVLDTAADS